MNKLVSATDLAKMLYCEASVTQKASFSSLDLLHMNKSKDKHKHFEQTLRTLRAADNTKETSLPNIKVINLPANLNIPTTLTFQGSNPKGRDLRNIIAAAIIITTVVTFYLLTIM